MTPGESMILGVLMLMFSTMPPRHRAGDAFLLVAGAVLAVAGLVRL